MSQPITPTSYKDIVPAIYRGDGQFIIDALHALPVGAKPKELIRRGLESQAAHGGLRSFAWHCVQADQPGVLSYFLHANGLGITLDDCCNRRVYTPQSADEYRSLAEESVRASNYYCLRLALELEPEQEALTFSSFAYESANCSLHYMALADAVEQKSAEALHCAQLLRDDGAPIFVTTGGQQSTLHALQRKSWPDELAPQLGAALRKYHELGLVDLDMPVPNCSWTRYGVGHPPLLHAIVAGYHYLAGELIKLGCDLDLDFDKKFAGSCSDLMDLVDQAGLAQPEHMRAHLTEALMSRQIGTSLAGVDPTPSESTLRRPSRVGL
ncbi:hypothetical protein [Paucibacter soli]|uniref:hypothetical protein n=1 Tax=Paucibacter soli TaxID=3133433 RepID=UPI0030B415EA